MPHGRKLRGLLGVRCGLGQLAVLAWVAGSHIRFLDSLDEKVKQVSLFFVVILALGRWRGLLHLGGGLLFFLFVLLSFMLGLDHELNPKVRAAWEPAGKILVPAVRVVVRVLEVELRVVLLIVASIGLLIVLSFAPLPRGVFLSG